MKIKVKRLLLSLVLLFTVCTVYAQQDRSGLVVDYQHPRKYIVASA